MNKILTIVLCSVLCVGISCVTNAQEYIGLGYASKVCPISVSTESMKLQSIIANYTASSWFITRNPFGIDLCEGKCVRFGVDAYIEPGLGTQSMDITFDSAAYRTQSRKSLGTIPDSAYRFAYSSSSIIYSSIE